MGKTIQIKCKGSREIEIDQLIDLQGDLKELTKVNAEKLKRSILKYGFSFPVFVWENKKSDYIIDAHQRKAVLLKMRDDGYTIPKLPIVDIEAKNKKEAKEKLLMLNSQYGKITDDGLYEYLEVGNINFDNIKDDLEFNFDLDRFDDNFYNELDLKVDEVEGKLSLTTCPKCGHEW